MGLSEAVGKAATLLASVVGQDLEDDEHGTFRIARRVAKNRIISTVDPDARHGHKTSARGFDGYKGHVAVDPDSELILWPRRSPRATPAMPAPSWSCSPTISPTVTSSSLENPSPSSKKKGRAAGQ